MKPDPDGSRLKLQDLRNLLGGEFFHVVEHKNNAQWRGDDEDRLMQQMMLFGVEQIPFRALPASWSNRPNSSSLGINSSSESICAGAVQSCGACASTGFW